MGKDLRGFSWLLGSIWEEELKTSIHGCLDGWMDGWMKEQTDYARYTKYGKKLEKSRQKRAQLRKEAFKKKPAVKALVLAARKEEWEKNKKLATDLLKKNSARLEKLRPGMDAILQLFRMRFIE